jgi:hypothetical protein
MSLKAEIFMLFVIYCECLWPVCTGAHRPQSLTLYEKQHKHFCFQGHEKLPEDGTWMPKRVGACVSNKEVI